jgi:TPR repeat protein
VAGPSPIAPEQSGAVELAMAEKYLNGDADGSRNAFGAVPWLWKAVGKGNVQAAMTLSDLYLRGDGVAKNCDQARVLLDSAARKGEKAAADRLRNLQSFGCR